MKKYIMRKVLLLMPLVAIALIASSATCPDGVALNSITGTTTACVTVSLTAVGTGGHGTLVYAWSGGNSTNTAANTFTTVGTNTYTVTVTDDSLCTSTKTVSVTVNANPTAGITGSTTGCGPVALTATGGTSYAWSGGSSPNSATDYFNSGGSYNVTVTDAHSCTASTSTSVSVLATPSALITPGSPRFSICTGGSLTLNAPSHGNALSFNGGYVSATGYNVGTSNFTVEAWIYPTSTGRGVIAAEGGINCAAGFVFEFNNDTLILQTATSSGCQGTVAGTGLVLNQWQHVAASVTRGNSGNGTVLFLDGNPIASGFIPNGNLNSSSLTIGGSATSGYNFTGSIDEVRIWNTALSQPSVQSSEYSIVPANSPNLVNYYRFDEGTGTTTADLSGGVSGSFNGTISWQSPATSPVYENGGQTLIYNWSTGATSQSTAVNAPGNYVVLVTNPSTSCTATDTVAVSLNAAPTAHVDPVGQQCPGNTLSLNATGGNSYTWSGPNSFTSSLESPSISNITSANAGQYIVTVTGPLGCTASAYVSVVVHTVPNATASNSGPACAGSGFTLAASGGTTFAWSGPNSFSAVSGDSTLLAVTTSQAGTYDVTVTDGFGCTASATTSVTVNASPTASATITGSPTCAGGTFYLSASGGTSYAWSGPNGYQSFSSNDSVTSAVLASSGAYNVTVTDANSCTATSSASATVNAVPIATAGSNSPLCTGASLSLSSGPSSETSYAWSGPGGYTSSSQTIASTTAVAGTYTVTITDANGCSASASTAVTVNSPPSAPIASNSGPVCAGSQLLFSVTAADSYVWSGPNGFSSTSQGPVIGTAVSADSGAYTVTVTTSGCSATATTSASVNTTPVATATNSTVGTQCSGENIYLAATGGATYNWSGPIGFQRYQQNDTIIGAGAAATGTYYVTVTDPNGCSATASTSLIVIDVPAVTVAGLNDTVCAGETLNLTATGGTTYSWTGPNGFTSTDQNPYITHTTSAAAGTYTVFATNAGGCTSSASTTIEINVLPVITSCPGDMTVNETPGLCSAVVNFTVTATGTPAADLWYSQNPGTVFVPGTTLVRVNAYNTCGSATCTFNVTVVDNQAPVITCPANIAILATEATDTRVLTIPLPVTSDNCGVASVINSFNGTGNASGTYPAGTTNVVWTVTDINGLTSTCTQTVVVYPNLVLSGTANNTLCPGTYFGSVRTLVAGGQTPYSYLWSNGSTATGLSNLAAGSYTLTVTDAASNTVSETFTVETMVPVNQPVTPGAITGPAYVCLGAVNTYSIAAVPNTVSYLWTVPTGATIVSGQGTTQLSVKFPTSSNCGYVQVSAVNCIGNSNNAQLYVSSITVPSRPSSISGSAYVCAGGAIYPYSVPASSSNYPVTYTWTAPTNASIVSGQGTNAVMVKFATGYTSGSLSVVASDCAGNASATTLAVAVSTHAAGAVSDIDVYYPTGDVEPSGVCVGDTVSYTVNQGVPQQYVASYNWTAPTNSVIIAGQGTQVVTVVFLPGYTGGNISVYGSNCIGNGAVATQSIPLNTQTPGVPGPPFCRNTINGVCTACPGDTVTFSINALSNARSYTWTVPANTVLISGQGTTSIQAVVQPAFSGGNVTVYASNCAGNSSTNSLFVNIANPPGNPGTIQGPNAVCNGIAYNYIVGAASGLVESYLWSVPTGATIISGQGTTSIYVSYQSGFTGGTISVLSANCIINSNASTISVNPQTSVPGPWDDDDPIGYQDGDEISGTTNHCIGDTSTFTADYAVGASTFSWTVPANTTIVGGQGTTSVTVAFNTGYTGGTLSVVAANCVGNSVAATFRLTHSNCGIHDPTTIDVVNASDFDVVTYPNPFNGQFYLKVTTLGSEPVNMKIFDITGKIVEESNNIPYTQEVALGSRLESGVYLVEVKQGDNTKVIRVVKAE